MDNDHCLEDMTVANQFYDGDAVINPFFRELDHYILNDKIDENFANFFKRYAPTFYQMFFRD